MEAYIERLVEEQRDLNDKIGRLYDKIHDTKFMNAVGRERASLMNCQYEAMKSYGMVLSSRILLELEEGNVTLAEVNGRLNN